MYGMLKQFTSYHMLCFHNFILLLNNITHHNNGVYHTNDL